MNLKLKAKIVERFGTQADFGEAIGIDDSIISKIIRGRRTLDSEKQIVWAQALRSTPRELFEKEQV
jgi:transcriptional regulator with XRE-family HTH domain